MSEDAHRHEAFVDFSKDVLYGLLVFAIELFQFRNEKQSEGALFHLPRKPTGEEHKKDPKKSPKGTPKLSSGTSEDSQGRSPKPVTEKSDFCRRSLPGGFGVCLPRALEMGPWLYIDI